MPPRLIPLHRRPPAAISTSQTRWKFVLLLAAAGIALGIGASLWSRATERFWRSPIADARFQTITNFDGMEQAAAISDDHQLRWNGAGRGDFTRRSVRGVSVGPGRTDGPMGHAGRFRTAPQFDPRERAGTRG